LRPIGDLYGDARPDSTDQGTAGHPFRRPSGGWDPSGSAAMLSSAKRPDRTGPYRLK
jgi:hypothetical protein